MQTVFNLQVEVESQWVEIFSEGSFLFIYEFSPENIHIITYLKQENYKKKIGKNQSYEIKSPPWKILWFRILVIFSVENIKRLCVFMFQT